MDTTLNAVQVASLLIGVVIPLIVGLVTHKDMRIGTIDVRPLLLAALSVISATLTEFLNVNDRGEDFNWTAAGLTALMTFVVAVGVHYGFWKPTSVAERAELTLVHSRDSRPDEQQGRRRAA